MDKEVIIYTIECPFSNYIFYVGKTNSVLKHRLSNHINQCVNLDKKEWINNILSNGGVPIIKEIDFCSKKDAYYLEIFWIHTIKSWGFNLTNMMQNNRSWHNVKLYKETHKKSI